MQENQTFIKDKLQVLTLTEVQEELFEILTLVDTIFRRNQVEYILSFGTLLGAVRHKGFIPWDDDVDIHILKKDYTKALAVLEQELPERYILHRTTDEKLPWDIDARVRDTLTFIPEDSESVRDNAKGLYIDFFEIPVISPLNRINLSLLRKTRTCINNTDSKVQKFLCKLSYYPIHLLFSIIEFIPLKKVWVLSDKWSGGTHQEDAVLPLRELPFNDRLFFVPKNYHQVLTKMYGDYSVIPKEAEQKTHYGKCYKIEN